jgi:hypothetical protein
MAHVAKWIFSVIQTSLTVGAPSAPTDYEELAMAFWDVDLLPNKKTIGSYWDYSPFEALRRAPPLTSVEAEVEDTVPPLPASPCIPPLGQSLRLPRTDWLRSSRPSGAAEAAGPLLAAAEAVAVAVAAIHASTVRHSLGISWVHASIEGHVLIPAAVAAEG